MKIQFLTLAVVCLALSLVLFACDSQQPDPSKTTQSPVAAPNPSQTGYAGLGLSDSEIKMLEERGVANVDSAEAASKIAGFTIVVPAYLPDDFVPGKFMINLSGGGSVPGITPKFNNTKVQQTFVSQENKNATILLIQSPQRFTTSGGRQVLINGQSGEMVSSQADPDKGQAYDRITLSWEKDGKYYALTGILDGMLNEAELVKIASSIGD